MKREVRLEVNLDVNDNVNDVAAAVKRLLEEAVRKTSYGIKVQGVSVVATS